MARVADRTVGARGREKEGGESRKQPALAWCVPNPQPPDIASSHFSVIFSRTGRRARVDARKKVESQESNPRGPGVCQTLSHLTSHPQSDTTRGCHAASIIRAIFLRFFQGPEGGRAWARGKGGEGPPWSSPQPALGLLFRRPTPDTLTPPRVMTCRPSFEPGGADGVMAGKVGTRWAAWKLPARVSHVERRRKNKQERLCV